MDNESQKGLLQTSLDRHYEEILNFMYLRLQNRADAEDLAQDTYLRAVKSISNYRGESSLRTWIFSIARKVLADRYEKRRKKRQLVERLKQNLFFVKNIHDSTAHETLFSLLAQLKDEEKDLVIFKHYFGFSYEEIAKMTGITTNNVGVRLMRIRQKLSEGGDENELV